ncbi:MAG: response regulator [Nitrospirae bacterium]|nr:response regulator [Nitrospirota bacterium]
MRILVVDDEQAFLFGLKRFLNEPEMSVDTVETFEDAIDFLNKQTYDVVIADVRLTGVLQQEGLEILKIVKKYKPLTKVIIITGYGTPEVMQEAYELGVDYYFEKPVSADILLNILKKMK